MQKWEYCTVMSIGHKSRDLATYEPCIIYFTPDGHRTTVLKSERGVYEETKTAQIIAQLGNDGWELVGVGNTSASWHALYFKRPKS